MAGNSFGTLFRFTTWGESHGPAIGVVVDGTPPRLPLAEADIQHFLDRRRPGQSRFTTQRQEPDAVKILSGVFEGETTGTPIQLLIENTDQRPRDYGNLRDGFRPGHARRPFGSMSRRSRRFWPIPLSTCWIVQSRCSQGLYRSRLHQNLYYQSLTKS